MRFILSAAIHLCVVGAFLAHSSQFTTYRSNIFFRSQQTLFEYFPLMSSLSWYVHSLLKEGGNDVKFHSMVQLQRKILKTTEINFSLGFYWILWFSISLLKEWKYLFFEVTFQTIMRIERALQSRLLSFDAKARGKETITAMEASFEQKKRGTWMKRLLSLWFNDSRTRNLIIFTIDKLALHCSRTMSIGIAWRWEGLKDSLRTTKRPERRSPFLD